MKMNRTIVFLFLMAIARTAPVSHNERSSTGNNKDVLTASNVSEHDVVKNNQEYFEHQNAKKASEKTNLISEGHGGAKSEESGIKESHAGASPVVGAADFVDGNGNGDGKAKANLSSVQIPGSQSNKAANGNGARGGSINGNMEDSIFSSLPNGTGGQNVHDTNQTELSRLDQNDEKCSDGEKATSRNKAGDRCDDTAGSHSNQVQSLTSTNVGVPQRREPADNTSLMGSKVYGESIHWTDMNEGASGHGGDTSEEGSTDGWGNGNSEHTKDLGAHETEKHGIGSKSQAHDGAGTTNPNQGGDGDRANLDDSLSTSEEDSSQQDNSMSAEKDEFVELCDKAKKNEHTDILKKRSGILGLKGIGKGKNSPKKNRMAGNHGVTDGDLNEKRRTILPDDRKATGGFTDMNSSQGANKHRNKARDDPEDSCDISNEDKSSNAYSFSDEFMQGDDPNDSHGSEGSVNSEKDEAESTSVDASDEQSVSNDGDSGSQPHSSETEDVSQSASSESKPASSENKSDNSESKSDSSNESENKSESSKSDSSSEGKSESSEGKSDSSSESKLDSSSESKSTSSESKSESSESKSESSESKSESSEGKSDSSSEGKSDSSSESKSDSSSESKSTSSESKSESSESKSESSEGKSDSSSEGKSDSSSESKSDSSSESKSTSSESKSGSSSESKSDGSESKPESSSESDSSDESESRQSSSQAASREKDSQSSTNNDASDESKSNESESQSASHSDSRMVSVSAESDAEGSDVADTTENTSDSESAENKESDGDSPLGSVDSESESVSEGSESNDSTSDY